MGIKSIEPLDQTLIPTPLWELYTSPYRIYPPRVISVTQLISSPLKLKLLRENFENITRDLKFLHYQIFGTMIHYLFELKEFHQLIDDLRHAYYDGFEKLIRVVEAIISKRERKKICAQFEGWEIRGEVDLFEDNILYDFKVTSKYSLKFLDRLKRYEHQLQLYRYFLSQNGEEIQEIANVLLLRDWSFLRDREEIPSPLYVIKYDIWPDKVVEEFIRQRLKLHEAEAGCDDEDMMLRIRYQVGKKIFSDLDKAKEYAQKKRLSVERIYEPIGCMYFCEVSDYCEQWKTMRALLDSGSDGVKINLEKQGERR